METENQNKTVFIVDDDLDDLALAMRILKDVPEFCEIVTLSSGDSLMDEMRTRGLLDGEVKQGMTAKNADKNLVLLDLHMPGENGIRILQALKDNPNTQNIPVLMLTEDSGTGNIEETYHLRANGYLTKPLQHNHLNIIRNIFAKAKHRMH